MESVEIQRMVCTPDEELLFACGMIQSARDILIKQLGVEGAMEILLSSVIQEPPKDINNE